MPRRALRLVLIISAIAGASSCAKKEVRTVEPPRATPVLGAMQRVIPAPISIEPAAGNGFVFTAETVILAEPKEDVMRVARYLAAAIGPAAGPGELRVEPRTAAARAGAVELALKPATRSAGDALDESYELTVSSERIAIVAPHAAGLFYGVQTLRQLLPPWVEYRAARSDKGRPLAAPAGRVVDRPRFGWRGAMLDVARHFFDADDVKRYIDLIALYKINRLHLHLADDQGWRIEIKSWPKLTTYGGSTEVGGGAGRLLLAGASTRISSRTRRSASSRSFPRSTCPATRMPRSRPTGTELRRRGARAVHRDQRRLQHAVRRQDGHLHIHRRCRPRDRGDDAGPYYHVGGDEVEKLTPAQYRQFIERVQAIVQKHGKEMVGWDEVAAARAAADVDRSALAPEGRRERVAKCAASDRLARGPCVSRHEVRAVDAIWG